MCPTHFYWNCFKSQLPTNAQSILAFVQDLTPVKAAKIAGKVLAITLLQASSISPISPSQTDSKFLKELKFLREEVDSLRHSRSQSRSRLIIGKKPRSKKKKNAGIISNSSPKPKSVYQHVPFPRETRTASRRGDIRLTFNPSSSVYTQVI